MAPLWITEAEVGALLDLPAAIDALEAALRLEADGQATNMLKTHVVWGHNTLHALGAVFPQRGFAGTKTWAHTGGGASPLLILFDSSDGSVRAILEAFRLGQLRTGAASGVATRWLATAAADELAVIGSGKQALMQVAAVHAVRPLRRVRVFSPTPEHRDAFARRITAELGIDTQSVESVDSAVRDVPIVTTVTRSRQPFLYAASLAPGTHINAVGAITPERAEIAGDVLARCDSVVADSVPAAQQLARELTDYFGTPEAAAWSKVEPLCRLVADAAGRPAVADLTLFKAMGTGLADLAVGVEVYRRKVGK